MQKGACFGLSQCPPSGTYVLLARGWYPPNNLLSHPPTLAHLISAQIVPHLATQSCPHTLIPTRFVPHIATQSCPHTLIPTRFVSHLATQSCPHTLIPTQIVPQIATQSCPHTLIPTRTVPHIATQSCPHTHSNPNRASPCLAKLPSYASPPPRPSVAGEYEYPGYNSCVVASPTTGS